MDLDLGLAASFLVLADERSYGRAARRLHLTAPALTKRIQRLERQLGATLLERGPSGVLDLTSAGRRFAAAARPLLDHAHAVRETARAPRAQYPLRVGIAAGCTEVLNRIDIAGVGRAVRCDYPDVRVDIREVPFPAVNRCLPERGVDALITTSPVRHVEVESVPLALTASRIGVVGARHPLAEAGSIDVGEFCSQPMLFAPATPAEWMEPFWFGDLRCRREAGLVETSATDKSALLLAAGDDVVFTLPGIHAPMLGPRLRPLRLVGAPPLRFYLALRRADHWGGMRSLLKALHALGPRHLG